jgi:hypothetical protein
MKRNGRQRKRKEKCNKAMKERRKGQQRKAISTAAILHLKGYKSLTITQEHLWVPTGIHTDTIYFHRTSSTIAGDTSFSYTICKFITVFAKASTVPYSELL